MVMNTNGNSGVAKIGPPPLDVLRDGGHLERRVDDDDADRQESNRADLHERADVVARGQQHPDRQHRGGEAVDHQQRGELVVREHEPGPERRGGDPFAKDDAQEDADHAADGRLLNVALPPLEHVEAHEDGERNGEADREGPPGALGEGVDDDDAEAGDRDDDDEQHGDRAGDAGHGSDLGARDLGERPAAAARRRPQDGHVVHGAGKTAAGDQPEESGRVAPLRGQRRPDQRSGAGNRGEVVAEEHPAAAWGSSCGRRTSNAQGSPVNRRAT